MSLAVYGVDCSPACKLAFWLLTGVTTTGFAADWTPELGVSARLLSDREFGIMSEVTVNPAFQYQAARTMVRASARFRFHDDVMLDAANRHDRTYWDASKPFVAGRYTTAELREFHVTTWINRWQFDVGKQLLNWGTLDGYKILDAVNPQDFREFVLDDFASSRIGLWAVRALHSGPGWHWELVWSPDRTVHDLADASTAFELTAPRFRLGQAADGSSEPIEYDGPNRNQAALRLSRSGENWDLSLAYIDGFAYEPVVSAAGPTFRERFPRRRLLGASTAAAIGAALFRIELGYEPKHHLNGVDGESLAVDQARRFTAGLGLDVDAPWNLFFNFQLIRDQLRGSTIELFRPEKDTIATAYVRKTFRNDTLRFDLRVYRHIEDHGSLWRVRLSYDLSRIGQLAIGADQFSGGTSNGLFGQFSDQDRVYLRWEKTF